MNMNILIIDKGQTKCSPEGCFMSDAWQARQAELEAARLAKEKEEEEAKQAAQQAKKEKDIQKKAIKKERQKLRSTCKVKFSEKHWFRAFLFCWLVKHDQCSRHGWTGRDSLVLFSVPTTQNWNYFSDNEAESVKMMEEVEKLCDRLELTRYSVTRTKAMS